MTFDRANFVAPTAEQVRGHLEAHPPRAGARWWGWVLPGLLGFALAASLSGAGALVVLLPWLAMLGFVGYLAWRASVLRGHEREAQRVQELAMLRRPIDALRAAWRLLPKVTGQPALHAPTVAVTAHALERLGCHEQAVVVYEFLIDHLPREHGGATQFSIQRAIAQLRMDQLTDADTQLRKLRQPVERAGDAFTAALYRLALLLQQVATHHDAEAAAATRRLVRDLRPLGVEAGLGHALAALAYHRLARHAGEAGDAAARPLQRRAAAWWRRATTLLDEATIRRRLPMLAEVSPC